MGTHPELVPWTVAQIWTSLDGLDPSLRARAGELRQFMTSNHNSNCSCWSETSGQPPHAIVTAWVLSALAHYEQAATISEINWVLERQGSTGWWSMFPSTSDKANASTSATAMTALALFNQLAGNLIVPEQRDAVKQSIDRAVEWLKKRSLPGEARWKEYPPEATFEKGVDYKAVSALVIGCCVKSSEPKTSMPCG
jgi:hypothetical protein